MIGDAGEQVTSGLVCLRKAHAAGLVEHLQQVAACKVGVAELLHLTAMHKACGGNTSIIAVARADGLLHSTVLSVGVANGTPEFISQLCNEVGDTVCQQAKKVCPSPIC